MNSSFPPFSFCSLSLSLSCISDLQDGMSFKDNLYAHFFSNFLISFVLCFLDICCTTLIVFSGDGTISFTSFFGVLVITRSPDSLIQVPRSIFAIDVAGLMSKKKTPLATTLPALVCWPAVCVLQSNAFPWISFVWFSSGV